MGQNTLSFEQFIENTVRDLDTFIRYADEHRDSRIAKYERKMIEVADALAELQRIMPVRTK